jgi:sulfur dioxygenase
MLPIMIFRQLFDNDSSTYTYLLADATTREAVIIDAVFEQVDRDSRLIEELGLSLRFALDTHVHADHVTALSLLRERFGARTVVSERSGSVCSDLQVKHDDQIRFGQHVLEVRETPGHTSGCLSFVCAAERLAFTGDALLIRGCGRTDFQEGDPRVLFRSVREQLFSLPDDTLLYPAHDYKGRGVTTVIEEKRCNPRLGLDKDEAAFVQIMQALQLPRPRKIDQALEANLQCGTGAASPRPALSLPLGWPGAQLSAAGVPEVEPDWLIVHEGQARLIDVREPDEYRGELGHLESSVLVPLGTLRAAAASWAREREVVTICRSGGRSGKAALVLAELGFARVASLRGGMRAWNERGLPVKYGAVEDGVMSRQG